MIKITKKALDKVKEISLAEDIGHNIIRLKVMGGGCAGMTYDMHFDEMITDLDETMDFDDVKIIIDPLSYQYLDEVTLDYIDSEIASGFKFLNPAVKSTCGCGSSVSF